MRPRHKIITIGTALLALAGSLATANTNIPQVLLDGLETAVAGQQVALGPGFPGILSIPAFNASPNNFRPVPGTAVYSDDPETVNSFGRLYTANVSPGTVTVYTYHVNGTNTPGIISVILENPSNSVAAELTFGRRAIGGASANYMNVGRVVTERFFTETTSFRQPVSIPPGGRLVLDPDLHQRVATINQLVNGWHEFTTSAPLTVISVLVASTADPLAVYTTLPQSPRDGLNRHGTFPLVGKRNNASYAYDTSVGMRRVRIGNTPEDAAPAGVDDQTGQTRHLLGSYGLVYTIDYTVTNSTGEKLAVVFNPRGGAYGGWFELTYDGEVKRQMVPTASLSVTPPIDNAGVIAILEPRTAPTPMRLVTSPAGAMSLPIDIILIPFGQVDSNADGYLMY